MQTGFLLGNVAAPIVLSTTGNVLVLISIIPLELGVLWWWGWRRLKVPVSLPRLLLMVLIANLVTAIVGIPFGFNVQFSGSAGTAFFFMPIALVLSILIEWAVYLPFVKLGQMFISKRRLFTATMLANLASYLLFFVFLSTQAYPSPLWKGNPRFANRTIGRVILLTTIQSHLERQTAFYRQNDRFSPEIAQNFAPDPSQSQGRLSLLYQMYRFEASTQSDRAVLMAKPKEADFNSYTAVVFAVKKQTETIFVEGVCQADHPSLIPPPIPKRVNQSIQCAAGSSAVYPGKFEF
ncbi:MAG: type IV pilin-like G/H family protein [Scytolyngbya sp. HA4215-MV1]|jgi:hypothetical protein|nr:type IV pilin-like G/H family protein [Scytolyngbya sp. HA4215-MV1]